MNETDVLLPTLQSSFGYTAFRPGQAEALGSVLSGQHTLVVMPTGAGKSLVYQLAALRLPGVTLVISPLIALMKDQVDSLQARGLDATYINSSLDSKSQRQRIEALADGAVKIVYLAPERLRSLTLVSALKSAQVSLLAVDEAHCLSQWGHDFRPDYLHIAEARRVMGNPVTLALTATATPQVQNDIVRLLDLPSAERIVTGFNRPNLTFEVCYAASPEAKLAALRDTLRSSGAAGLVYVGTRRDAEEVAEFARAVCGWDALYYHAGLAAEERAQTQEAFMAGDAPLIVATNAFGMGVDRPDVRFVLHYTLPGSLEAYYQEAGRAGRDGLPARCVLLYAPQDRALQEWFIENDAPALEDLHALYAAIQTDPAGATAVASLYDLSLATGLHEVKVKLGLALLEGAGALHRLGDAGARMYLTLDRLNEPALRAALGQAQARRDAKRRQLARMVAYAETNGCRRRILLAHFGDKDATELEVCCDNCSARAQAADAAAEAALAPDRPEQALDQAQRAALVVLDAVRRIGWGVGRHKLAQILKGSRAKDLVAQGYNKSVYYGRFAEMPLTELCDWVDQLVAAGYLKLIGSDMPVLCLTPRGESAIKARAAFPLRLSRAIQPQVAARKMAVRAAGGTQALTGQLLAGGLTPAQIAAQRGLHESTIYSHLAQLIKQGELEVEAAVPEAVRAQVEAAIERCAHPDWLSAIRSLLPETIGYGEISCVVEARRRKTGPPAPVLGPPIEEFEPEASIADFLTRVHPRPLAGPWAAGWALDFHSRFSGAEWTRSEVGELVYRYKYEEKPALAETLAERLLELIRSQPELAQVDAIVPTPPSLAEPRRFDPVKTLCDALAHRLSRPVWPALVKTRATAPQKEMHSLAQKRANVAGAFGVPSDQAERVRGRRLLVLDDLYDSGATLEEVTRTLLRAGAAAVLVLTLTRTIHADG